MAHLLFLILFISDVACAQDVVTLDISKTGATVRPELYGYNFEFTRHDNFEGLKSEVIANRKFALPTSCSTSKTDYSCWPKPVQQMMNDSFLPRWKGIGEPVLDQPYWSEHSSLLSGQMGHSIHCSGRQGECGVEQSSYFAGFDSGKSFGSAIVLQQGEEYTLRVVLRGKNNESNAIVHGSMQARSSTYTQAFDHIGNTAVCEESSRLDTACDNCGPDWGDLSRCKALCDEDDRCRFITYFANNGCRMYSACKSVWNQTFGVSSHIFKKAAVSVRTLANFSFRPTSTWSTFEATIKSDSFSNDTTLKISGVGEWWLGSVSLTPRSNTWRGMRRDVIAELKSTGFRGLLRYPGGCFAEFYRWQVGLLDSDMQPPISTPFDYCAAVPGGVNAYTDGTMQNGVGIDDYIALTEELGMEPAITVRLVAGSDEEIKEAAAWVEYCNGDAETSQWGRVRAARGYTKPYNVKYWYLGNEAFQLRYPSYPASSKKLGQMSSGEYAEIASKLAQAMLKASPQTPLRLFAEAEYLDAAAAALGDKIYATSFHGGYSEQPSPDDWTAETVTAAVKVPIEGFLTALEQTEKVVNSTGKDIVISADEWGLGSPWLVKTFGVVHGMYAASFLSAVTNVSGNSNLQLSNYFEPINEGAITVGPGKLQQFPIHASLTPVGQVMGLYAEHQGGMRLFTSSVDVDNNLNVVATLHPDKTVIATVLNLNAVGWTTRNLTVQLLGGEYYAAETTELKAQGFAQDSMFETSHRYVTVFGRRLELAVPPLSVVHVRLSTQDATYV